MFYERFELYFCEKLLFQCTVAVGQIKKNGGHGTFILEKFPKINILIILNTNFNVNMCHRFPRLKTLP